MPQAIDYAALADQARQTAPPPAVDYAALAAQARGDAPAGAGAMNFAIVNGHRVSLDGLPEDIKQQLTDHAQHGDVLLDNIKNIASSVKDVGVGALKQLATSGVRGGALLRKIPGVETVANALPSVTVPITPTNPMQKVGGMVEQAAEIAAPARAVAAVGEKAGVAAAPYLAHVFSPTLAKLVPEALVMAGGNAALVKAQGGSNLAAGVTAGISSAMPTTGMVASALAQKFRSGAAEDVAHFFSPTTKAYKGIVAKRTGEILDRGSEVLGALGRNREGAVDVFTAQREAAGEAVDEALKQFGSATVTDAPQRIMDALEKAKAPYIKTRIVSAAEAAGPMKQYVTDIAPTGEITATIPLHATKVKQIDGLKQIVAAHGDQMTIDDLVGLRRAWDEVAYQRPGATIETVKTNAQKWAKKMGGDAIRGIIESDHPDLAAINREFSFWKDLDTVMRATVERKVGQVGGLLPSAAEGAGRVSGAVAKGTLGGMLVVGKLAKVAQQVFSSPRYASLSANMKTAIATALSNGQTAQAESLLRMAALRIGVVEAPRALLPTSP